ncbi:transferase, transferring glycosyl groups, putative [Ricinus communis]|uniref:Transferase, transferring glycosyl groups, putative n=1 Tax=Ricinus communis TaxID=3988 RepID=B9RWP7_RICCO|nr:transferase, transferring glycosyl groups, putative [Ricinus communis]|eukprot:XP_002518166.1 beta-glucuronosyltransferase GlcAT14A [Ricinus communis]
MQFLQPPVPAATTTTTAINSPTSSAIKDSTKTTLSIILATSLFSLLFILSLSPSTTSLHTTTHARPDPYLFPNRQPTFTKVPSDLSLSPPSIAYLISGSKSDTGRILRLLYATYHPKNQYLLHLDRFAPQSERDKLALAIQSVPIFKAALNVNVIGKADFAYPKGSSSISATLHGAAILLRLSKNWDWFINLNAGDYPLVTQDDLLHIFSYLPRDFNFVNHTSYIGWREAKRLKPIIVDPGLYLSERSEIFYATQKRELPNAFRIFTGSSFSIVSRNLIDHCILGTDNLPRILLMYFSNTPSSLTNYFPSIICNSRQFNRTVVNHNLQYVAFEKSSMQEQRMLNSSEFHTMIQSGAAFATGFKFNDPVLDRIDQEILGRNAGQVVPGGWCLGEPRNSTCSVWGDADVLRPGPGAARLEKTIVELLSKGVFRSNQCIIE